MSARKPALLCLLVLGVVAAAEAPGWAEPEDCAVPAEMTASATRLPRLAARLGAHQPVTIVAIGGASTKGAAAGAAELAYPSRLQEALTGWFPDAPIKVVNKGVPRQTAEQMLDRFPTDVIAEDPVMVVWETGIVDAVRGVEIDDFAGAVQRGLDELKNRAVDIVLMDMQFSRSTATVIDFERYLHTLHRMGELNNVYVFPRYAMMRYWSEQNVFNFDQVAADDRAKLAAKVYSCIGRRLGEFIRHAVR